jgi:hypothetical protein
MQFSDNEIIALLFGTSLSEPRGMYVLLQLVPAVYQKRSATNSGDGKTLTLNRAAGGVLGRRSNGS